MLGTLVAVPSAHAATLSVDDDGQQCPAAQFASVQDAVDAAAAGDTIAVCPGRYVEGTGTLGTNALTISKSVTIKGAGADVVAIEPRRGTPTGGQIAEAAMNIRNGIGDIVSIKGTPAAPITVDLSGVTVDGNGVFSEAGVVYLDAQGTLRRDRVTNILTSISNGAGEIPGGYRSNNFGYGIAQVTAAPAGTGGGPARTLTIDHTRVDRYNKIGILIDAASGAAANGDLIPSGVINSGVLIGSQVIGRVQCKTFNTPTPPPYVLGGAGETPPLDLPGNCTTVGPTTTGATFGQDGIRVTAGSTLSVTDSTIAQNLVNGAAAPQPGSANNNKNLSLGAGIRLVGSGASSVGHSNVTDNAYGIFNVGLDGATANAATPVAATENWWGLRTTNNSANNGPAISPATNPALQENPVNGAATPDGTGTTSNAVDFFPFRSGNQADPDAGEWPVVYAPLPVPDAGPSVDLTTDKAEYNRGDVVKITLAAADDFGVTAVALFDGTKPIGVVTPPAGNATLTIPADAACAARTISAVASDYLGQSASDSAEIRVVGPNNCQGQPKKPAAPTVKLSIPASTIGQDGASVSATATADAANGASVSSVDFFVGTRKLCSDNAAPYGCSVLPVGREVGAQTVRAVVTDSVKGTASDQANVTVDRFRPDALTGRVTTKAAGKKIKGTVSGRITLPQRVTPEEACTSGTLTVSVKRGKAQVLPPTQVSLAHDCSYKLKFAAPKAKVNRFKASVRFGGNAVLQPASLNRRSR